VCRRPAACAQVIDEIGNEAEALAARSISQRGIQLIATAHGAAPLRAAPRGLAPRPGRTCGAFWAARSLRCMSRERRSPQLDNTGNTERSQ